MCISLFGSLVYTDRDRWCGGIIKTLEQIEAAVKSNIF